MGTFFNVKDYGAYGDDSHDDTAAINTLINTTIPASGATVYFPPGIYKISSTILIGNASSTGPSTRNGIFLLGEGMGTENIRMRFTNPTGASVLKWYNASGGSMVKFNGPIEGCGMQNLMLDGRGYATTLIESQRSFQQSVGNIVGSRWVNGYALDVHAANTYSGAWGGDAPIQHLYQNLLFSDPGTGANGISIGRGLGFNSQLTFVRCYVDRANTEASIGVWLGLCDHITFDSCRFGINGEPGYKGIGVQVEPYPQDDKNGFPQNVIFFGTALGGGIKLIEGAHRVYGVPALIFLPYFTADSQPLPPDGYLVSQGPPPVYQALPRDLVFGISDQQDRIGYFGDFGFERYGEYSLSATPAFTVPWQNIKHTSKILLLGTSNYHTVKKIEIPSPPLQGSTSCELTIVGQSPSVIHPTVA